MHAERSFATRSFWSVVIMNALLLGAIYMMTKDSLQANEQVIGFVLVGLVATLALWVLVRYQGQRMGDELQAELLAEGPARPAPTAELVSPAPPKPEQATKEHRPTESAPGSLHRR